MGTSRGSCTRSGIGRMRSSSGRGMRFRRGILVRCVPPLPFRSLSHIGLFVVKAGIIGSNGTSPLLSADPYSVLNASPRHALDIPGAYRYVRIPVLHLASPHTSTQLQASTKPQYLETIADVLDNALIMGQPRGSVRRTFPVEKSQWSMITSMSATLPGIGRGGYATLGGWRDISR